MARWFIIIFVIFPVGYAIFSITYQSETANSDNSSRTTVKTPSQVATVAERTKTSWHVTRSKDKMTGKAEAYATSVTVSAKPEMDFPYSDVKAWLGVGCNGSSEWAYVGFDGGVNLSDTETESGYNTFTTRIKWDGEITKTSFAQMYSDGYYLTPAP
jgi:hypothetical protein